MVAYSYISITVTVESRHTTSKKYLTKVPISKNKMVCNNIKVAFMLNKIVTTKNVSYTSTNILCLFALILFPPHSTHTPPKWRPPRSNNRAASPWNKGWILTRMPWMSALWTWQHPSETGTNNRPEFGTSGWPFGGIWRGGGVQWKVLPTVIPIAHKGPGYEKPPPQSSPIP